MRATCGACPPADLPEQLPLLKGLPSLPGLPLFEGLPSLPGLPFPRACRLPSEGLAAHPAEGLHNTHTAPRCERQPLEPTPRLP